MPDLLTCLLLAWAVLATVAALVYAMSSRDWYEAAIEECRREWASYRWGCEWRDRYAAACAIAREAHARLEACRAAGHAVGKRMRHFEAWALHHLRRRREQVWALESGRKRTRVRLARGFTLIRKLRAERDEAREAHALLSASIPEPQGQLSMHWLWAAYERRCTGEDEREVLLDFGYVPVRERDEARADAENRPCVRCGENMWGNPCCGCYHTEVDQLRAQLERARTIPDRLRASAFPSREYAADLAQRILDGEGDDITALHHDNVSAAAITNFACCGCGRELTDSRGVAHEPFHLCGFCPAVAYCSACGCPDERELVDGGDDV